MSRRKWTRSLESEGASGSVDAYRRHSSLLARVDGAAARTVFDGEPTEEMIARAAQLLRTSKRYLRGSGLTNGSIVRLAKFCGGQVVTNANGRPEGGEGLFLAERALDIAADLIAEGKSVPAIAKHRRREGSHVSEAERVIELVACGLDEDRARYIAREIRAARDKHKQLRMVLTDGRRLSAYLADVPPSISDPVLQAASRWEKERLDK